MYVLELAGEDDRFAAAEAASAAGDPTVVAPGLAVAEDLDPDRLAQLAYTHRASRLVGRTRASIDAAERLLGAALDAGDAGAPLPVTGAGPGAGPASDPAPISTSADAAPPTVAVRARDVRSTAGVATDEAERALGQLLVDRGFAVDLDAPERELRALFAGDRCLLGWFALAADRGFGDRAPTDRPFFQPGSMDPLLARALVNLALPGAIAGRSLLDPMCGTGGVLIEAALVGARALGADVQWTMVRGSRRNLREELPATASGGSIDGTDAPADAGDWALVRGDATRLALRDGAIDAVVFDAPYGRQSKVVSGGGTDATRGSPASRAGALVGDALAEARRVLADGGRAVVVADRALGGPAREAGFAVGETFERRVHRSLTRYVHVLA